jgi:hypothetical protein
LRFAIQPGYQVWPEVPNTLYLHGRTVAAIVYRYGLHTINLYVWPGNDAGAQPGIRVQRGYHVAHWTDGRMNFWVVSDAGDDELAGFIKALRVQISAQAVLSLNSRASHENSDVLSWEGPVNH